LGRSTKDSQIDVDLTLEGPAWKISRRQGVIRLKKNGEFSIVNEGKRPIYVDGRAVLMGCRDVLRNNSVIEVKNIYLLFHGVCRPWEGCDRKGIRHRIRVTIYLLTFSVLFV